MKNKFILFSFIFLLITSCGVQINKGFLNEIDNGLNNRAGSTPSTTVVSIDQTDDDNGANGYGGGTHTGTTYSSGALTLITITNNAELNESWAPRWDRIVAYWKLNESTWDGTTNEVINEIGVDHGTRGGSATTTSSSKLGDYAGIFNGTTDYVEVLNSATLNQSFTERITYSIWVKPGDYTAWPSTRMLIFGGGTSSNNRFNLLLNNAGEIRINSTPTGSRGSDGNIPVGVWSHVVLTYDTINGAKIYINGNLDTDLGFSGDFINAFSTDFKIGTNYNASSGFFEGELDDVAIWNAELSPEDIALIYSRQSAKFSGEMKSRIIDSKDSNNSWTNLDWVTTLPFGKEVPGSSGSESSVDYSSLVGTTGSTSDDDLMNGLVGLWHFNENSWNGTANEVIDSSGNSLHGTSSNNPNIVECVFNKCGSFTGGNVSNTGINVWNNSIHELRNELTMSIWVKPELVSGQNSIWLNGTGTNRLYQIRIAGGFFTYAHYDTGGAERVVRENVASITPNKWYHLVVTRESNGVDFNFYVNGVEVANNGPAVAAPTTSSGTQVMVFGRQGGTAQGYTGLIDEAILWGRSLNADEVLQLYRRGANRIKYQVRTCASDDCTDQDALTGDGWKGPGGNYLTYFSELYNNTSVTSSCTTPQECYASELTLQGDVGATKPSIYLDSFGTDGLLGLENNRYFQYRVIMESDDENTACNGGTETCMPELKSVTIWPEHSYEE